jgi:hypothetical protein
MPARISLTMLTISVNLYVSRHVDVQIVRVSSESDCSGAAFDHDVAAGATISTVCSPCQAGTYSSGAGWIPLRGVRTTMQPLLSAYGCSEPWTGWGLRTARAKSPLCPRRGCVRVAVRDIAAFAFHAPVRAAALPAAASSSESALWMVLMQAPPPAPCAALDHTPAPQVRACEYMIELGTFF